MDLSTRSPPPSPLSTPPRHGDGSPLPAGASTPVGVPLSVSPALPPPHHGGLMPLSAGTAAEVGVPPSFDLRETPYSRRARLDAARKRQQRQSGVFREPSLATASTPSTQELREALLGRYITPQTYESPDQRARRRRNRNQALRRFRIRRDQLRLARLPTPPAESSSLLPPERLAQRANIALNTTDAHGQGLSLGTGDLDVNMEESGGEQSDVSMHSGCSSPHIRPIQRRLSLEGEGDPVDFDDAMDASARDDVENIPHPATSESINYQELATRSHDPSVRRDVRPAPAALATLESFGGVHRFRLQAMNVRSPSCSALKWAKESKGACCTSGAVSLPYEIDPPQRVKEIFAMPSFQRKIRQYNSAFAFTSMGSSMKDSLREDLSVGTDVGGPYTFRINGAIHHRIGSLLPNEGATPAFAQIYFHDGGMVAEQALRCRIFGQNGGVLDPIIIGDLQRILHELNPLVEAYVNAREFARTSPDARLVLLDSPNVDQRRYNQPTCNEIAAIIVHDGPTASHRDVVLHLRGGGFRRIFETNPLFDPLQYPLIYLRGEIGWSPQCHYVEGVQRNGNTKVSLREHTSFRVHIKHPDVEYSLLHRAGRLMQQWCVDMGAKIIDQRLFYHRNMNSQRMYRRELFSGLADLNFTDHIVHNRASDLNQTGTHVILASSFQGDERFMRQQYYDAMAIVRHFGKPDLFVTVTCNPKWQEISDNLLPGQSASDGPDLVARVFNLRLNAILDDITKKAVFGEVETYMYVIEFQKRGLPHAHILLILKGEAKPRNAEDYDKFVSAEIPDPTSQPELYATVSTCMLHGPCGKGIAAPCMDGDKACKKGFPKPFAETTGVERSGYPFYRRRAPGPIDPNHPERGLRPTTTRVVNRKIDSVIGRARRTRREEVPVDNRWVVPYNPFLCQKYDCHINVEICSTVQSVKYLYKYVYKGQDRATFRLARSDGQSASSEQSSTRTRGGHPPQAAAQTAGEATGEDVERPRDEIQEYLDARYLSPPEAMWLILQFKMQKKKHAVTRLPVHGEGGQQVLFRTNERLGDVLRRAAITKLTAFFDLCDQDDRDGAFARTLLYYEIPIEFVWKKNDRGLMHWARRQRGGDTVIGRMVAVSPLDTERYHLRLLLCNRRGPRSYRDIKTVGGVEHETFKGAATALGLLLDDMENHRCLSEASEFQMPRQLRQLFAVILVYGEPISARALWDSHFPALSEDFERHQPDMPHSQQSRWVLLQVLLDVEASLISNGSSLAKFDELPQISQYQDILSASQLRVRRGNRLIEGERNYDTEVLQECLESVHQFTNEQRLVYDAVVGAALGSYGGENSMSPHHLFFLDGPGGTGKSFVLETILAAVRVEGEIALAVAGSGIAATLLTGGKTAHSTFKLPLDPDEVSTCDISATSFTAQLLQNTRLIVWDEAPMTHRYQFEALDRTLRVLRGNDLPFGGIVMLLSGDFRQTLPVIPKAGPGELIAASFKRSRLWCLFSVMKLTVNLRVRRTNDPSETEAGLRFANYLLRIGEGRHETAEGYDAEYAKIPDDIALSNDYDVPLDGIEQLIDSVFEGIDSSAIHSDDYFANRVILAPKNLDVAALNDMILDRLPGEVASYVSVDSIFGSEELHGQVQTHLYPSEFLNSLSLSGLPPHKLNLKVGAPVMLIRNINAQEGLCNGTRLRIARLERHCMEAIVMCGIAAGKRVIIPRLALISKNSGLPFEVRRKQFPVRLAFAMTINKSQGQSIANVGVYLPSPVFSHGQLYVALSRATSRARIRVLMKEHTIVHEGNTYTKNVVFRDIIQ